MGAREENIIDFQFIIERIEWFRTRPGLELIEHVKKHPYDGLEMIGAYPDSKLLGRDAAIRLGVITDRFLKSRPDRRKIDRSHIREEIKSLISVRFLKECRSLDGQSVDSLLGAAYKATVKDFEAREHFIPCTIFLTNKWTRFDVGPVAFFRRDEFDNQFHTPIDAMRKPGVDAASKPTSEKLPGGAETIGQPKLRVDSFVDQVEDAFKPYNWIAVVSIPDASDKASFGAAIGMVKGALNAIKLLAGGSSSDRIRTAHDAGIPFKGAKLWRAKEKFSAETNSSAPGNVWGDEILDLLTNGSLKPFYRMAANVLRLCMPFNKIPPLGSRFLDALSWYGDAVNDNSSAAKIMKFVTAIERIVGTEEQSDRGVTDIVVNRAALLYSSGGGSLGDCKAEIDELYECRSNLLHGTISPFDESVVAEASRADEIARMILLSGLDLFTALGMESPTMSPKKLRAVFDNLEKNHLNRLALPVTTDPFPATPVR
jgi:hypothetical protein